MLILFAFLCRVAMLYDCPVYTGLGHLRSLIYMAIPACWSISVGRRVIQPQLRRYLIHVAWLMVFWIADRTVKYCFTDDPFLTHWLWYLFYLPYILIPTLSIFVSEAHCKPETHRTPKRMAALFVPALVLLVIVLTNDVHQLAFTFPADGPKYPTDGYGYGPGYYAVVAWIGLCAVFSLAAILRKSRVPGAKRRIMIPMAILFLLIVYTVLYVLRVPFIKFWLNDMTSVFCLLLMAVFESFFRLNLIQTNTHYSELFRSSATPACIVDRDYRELSRSEGYAELSPAEMRRAEEELLISESRMRISSAPISIGHVLWQEDITELLEQIRELEDTRERLEGANVVVAEEYKTSLRQRRLVERNLLYDKMQTRTERQIVELSALVEALSTVTEREEEERLLKQIGVLGAYIKRRNNLFFLSEDQSRLPASELMYCIRESLQNLSVFGIPSEQYFAPEGELPFDSIVFLYDAFEQTLEAALDTLNGIFISVTAEGETAALTLRLCTNAELCSLQKCGLRALQEEPGEWLVTVSAPGRGGEEI